MVVKVVFPVHDSLRWFAQINLKTFGLSGTSADSEEVRIPGTPGDSLLIPCYSASIYRIANSHASPAKTKIFAVFFR